MLRCPPSRINLTNTDIIDFEARYNARQSTRLYARQRGNVRLSPGPEHYIASAITAREEHSGCASTPLQATMCSGQEDDGYSGGPGSYGGCGSGVGADAGNGSSDVQDLDERQVLIRTETGQVFESLSQGILSPRKAGKLPDFGDSPKVLTRETSSPVTHAAGSALESADTVLDGTIDSRPSVRPSPHPRKGLDVSNRPIPGEINSDAYPSSSKPLPKLPLIPPALSSTRARRRYTRSHGTDVHQDAHPPVELNPDAPAFIPQTRLAKNDRSSSGGSHSIVFLALEPRWNSLDSTHSTSSLRIRSSSEQNIELETSQRAAAAEHRHSRPLPAIPARRRPSNEHPLRLSPHLERYPLLRPRPQPQPQAQPSQQQQRRRSSRIQTRPPTPSTRWVPSMVSAASGISSSLSSRQTSVDGLLDASAEFLRMRSSPLDELTERISRVAASRQRSVGRSWERMMMPVGGRRRVELLSGELFRREGVGVAVGAYGNVGGELARPSAGATVVARDQVEGAAEDAGTQHRMPSASPPRATTSSVPSTPLNASGEPSACSPLAQKSPSKAAEASSSAVKRNPLPSEIATPKVPVYDDSKPPGTQPRTPADIPQSSRSRRQRSDTLTAMSPLTAMASPPSIPERHINRPAHPGTTPRLRRPAPASASRASQGENDLDGQVSRHPELEEDRRTWFSRQEEGSLESTPPREGRFEQFLS